MVVLVNEIVYLGRRRVRACTGGNQGDTRVSEELTEREGVSRGHDVAIDAGREHDVIGQIPSRYFGHEGTIRAIRRYLGLNGSGLDAIHLVNMLPEGIPEPDRELCQGYPETVEWPDISLVCDIWSREFREVTYESLHPSFDRPEIGRAPHPDRYDVWSVGRSARAIALPRTTSGNES